VPRKRKLKEADLPVDPLTGWLDPLTVDAAKLLAAADYLEETQRHYQSLLADATDCAIVGIETLKPEWMRVGLHERYRKVLDTLYKLRWQLPQLDWSEPETIAERFRSAAELLLDVDDPRLLAASTLHGAERLLQAAHPGVGVVWRCMKLWQQLLELADRPALSWEERTGVSQIREQILALHDYWWHYGDTECGFYLVRKSQDRRHIQNGER